MGPHHFPKFWGWKTKATIKVTLQETPKMMILQNVKVRFVYFQGLFPPGQGATIGVDFMIKTVDVDGDKVKVGTVR